MIYTQPHTEHTLTFKILVTNVSGNSTRITHWINCCLSYTLVAISIEISISQSTCNRMFKELRKYIIVMLISDERLDVGWFYGEQNANLVFFHEGQTKLLIFSVVLLSCSFLPRLWLLVCRNEILVYIIHKLSFNQAFTTRTIEFYASDIR